MTVLVTGTGRAGTSVLARILAECGLDPGAPTEYDPNVRAGRETILPLKHPLPALIKSPALSLEIENLVLDSIFDPEDLTVILPIRDRYQSAASRKEAGLDYWSTLNLTEDQVVGRVVEATVKFDIRLITLWYPRYLLDPTYSWSRLNSLFSIDLQRYTDIHSSIVDEKLIHHY